MSADFFLHLGTFLKWIGICALPLFLLPLLSLASPALTEKLSLRIIALIDRFTSFVLGAAIASAVTLLVAQLFVVVLRYAFGLSFTWLNEIVIYAFAAMFMLGAAAALRDDAHVRVDILRPRFGEIGRAWIELTGLYLFLFPICIRILMTGEQGLARSWSLFEGSRETDGLPILFLFKTLVPAFAVLMMTQGLSEALKAALRVNGRQHESVPAEEHGEHYGA